MGFEGYHGNKTRDKWSELMVEIGVIIASMGIFSFQIGCWVGLALVGWRISNIGRKTV